MVPQSLPELEKIIWRCIRKDSGRRFQHMGDVQIALQELKEESEARLAAGTPPQAVAAVHEDSGGAPIQLVGWCLGGIMSLLSAGGLRPAGRLRRATIASPFDFSEVRLAAPIRPVAALTGGRVVTALYRALGGAPAPLVEAGYKLAGLDKYLTKPWVMARHMDDRDFLAQLEAVDAFMGNMLAYPGRTFGQLYHRFFIVNELADGRLELRERTIDLADVDVPVLVVAGTGDGIAPEKSCRAVVDLLPNCARRSLRDRAGRAPWSAHRPRGASDDLGLPRRVPVPRATRWPATSCRLRPPEARAGPRGAA